MRNDSKKLKGIILPVVLIFFSFLMLLGVTFVSVGGFQVQQSISQVNRSQAYYLAKSGAETIAEFITKEAKNMLEYDDFIKKVISDVYVEVILTDNTHNVVDPRMTLEIKTNKVKEGNEEFIYIYSKAKYGNSERELTLKLLLDIQENLLIPKETAIIAVNNTIPLSIGNQTVILDGYLEFQDELNYPMPAFPDDIHLATKNDLDIKGTTMSIDENGYHSSITINSKGNTKGVLEINFDNDSDDRIRIIRVSNLDISGEIRLNKQYENNKVIIFVDDKLSLGKNKEVIVNYNGNPDDLHIYYAGEDFISPKNKMEFSGLIYAPNASIELHNNNKIFGSIIFNMIYFKNGPQIDSSGVAFDIPVDFFPENKKSINVKYANEPWIR